MSYTFNEVRLKVRSVIKRVTGFVSEDLEQEVFLKAIENKDKYQEEGKFIAWIKVVAQNMAKDMFKSAYFQNSCLSRQPRDLRSCRRARRPSHPVP